MFNNFVKGGSSSGPANKKKEIRKPVSDNFSPKRLAMSIDPPMIIIQYLVPETGKLYHHKMRLESKMRETLDKNEILKYLKVKHSDYFEKGKPKLKENQVLDLLEKILENYEQGEEEDEEQHAVGQNNAPLGSQPKQLLPQKAQFEFIGDGEDEDEYGQEEWDLDIDDGADIV